MSTENIYMFDGEDPKMIEAYEKARKTFKYFWRELSWENRRIIPGIDLAAVKVGFKNPGSEGPTLEHMWINQIDFDGVTLTGILMNKPNWVTNLKPNENVDFKLNQISDWMYVVGGKVYGAYTVNLMRSKMGKSERDAHDAAWGLDFGKPEEIEIFYKRPVKKSFFSMFKKEEVITDEQLMNQEHPMCINMADSLKKQLKESNEFIEYKDQNDNTMLHLEALAGNALVVQILLENGANPNLINKHGQKPSDLAKVLDWPKVKELLNT